MTSSSKHPDARSLLVLETHELSRRAGTMKEVHRTVPAPAGLGVEMIGVPEGSEIAVSVKLESVVEGIWVSGTAEVELTGECARCLRPLADEATLEMQELFYHPGRDAEEDASFVVDERIDLEPLLRDAVVLELPFTPVCRDDCAGLCVACGANLNDDPDHTHDEQIDPRWAALRDVTQN
ncbi:YceD family protein [Aestuariimicrobium ganziense]|uniref:YceD family protein n=1 Tax=Aestuariimicrobium ganziense TaxID=2773677 RepID=UPI0019423915|nr:YceD family protein [Aestuariimicrobium ganziense]